MDEKFIRGIKIDWNKIGKNNYARKIPSIDSINRLDFNSNITFFVGENGTGKSTLLESIAVAYGFNAEGGSKNFNFSTMDTHSDLYKAINVVKGALGPKSNFFLRAESFLSLIQNRFTANGLYILDEPEAALSPQRQLTLLMHIYNLAKKGSQFIIASHSPILLGIPEASILSFDEGIIREIKYEETESYRITELFINNKQLLLNNLLNNE